jgi:hypothetical protein
MANLKITVSAVQFRPWAPLKSLIQSNLGSVGTPPPAESERTERPAISGGAILTRDGLTDILENYAQVGKLYSDNESFRRFLTEAVFRITYEQPAAPGI